MSAGLLLVLLACGGKLPSALAPDAPTEARPTVVEVQDLPSATEALVGNDPLLRRPRVTADWSSLPDGAALADWAGVASGANASAGDWFALERRWPGTLAVPLARGARLADLETSVAGELRDDQQVAVIALLAPLSDLEGAGPSDIRPPLEWLLSRAAGLSRAEATLRLAERSVLLGWLDGPQLPLQAPAEAMQPGIHDRLVESPAGALLIARAAGARDAQAGAAGRSDLQQATTLALRAAAADRDSEQVTVRAELNQAAEQLRAEGLELPDAHEVALGALLRRSQQRLRADAADDASAGLALVALAAERWRNTCPDAPCVGLDRTASLSRAGAWGPQVAPTAAAWRVVFAKQALDTLEVTVDRPTYAAGASELVDLLVGTGSPNVDLSLLRQRSPGPSTWLALTRAAGAPDATTPEAGLEALRSLVVQICEAALAQPLPPEQQAAITRIRDRAKAD